MSVSLAFHLLLIGIAEICRGFLLLRVIGIPGAARVFENFGIDYCCGGHRTLADACQDRQPPQLKI
jgi:uncharacterized protein DUF542